MPKPLDFSMDDLVNLECLYASHNLIKDVFGISKLTTLLELNLSFNQIVDIAPLEELTCLEKLHLNRNKISIIDPVLKMTSLQVLGLFHNEIYNSQATFDTLVKLVCEYKLREVSIDGNPITSTVRFRNQLIVSLPKLLVLDEEKVRPLDREVAEKYFEVHNIPKPVLPSKQIEQPIVQQEKVQVEETKAKEAKPSKKVKFDIDDDHEGDW